MSISTSASCGGLQRSNSTAWTRASREFVLDTRDLQIDSVKTAPAGSNDFRTTRFELDRARRLPRQRIAHCHAAAMQHACASRTRRRRRRRACSGSSPRRPRASARRSCSARPRPCMHARWRRCRTRPGSARRTRATLRGTRTAWWPSWQPRVTPAIDAARRHSAFRMPQPIPSYLLALAVGDLDFRAVGPRTGVWAEPASVAAAAASGIRGRRGDADAGRGALRSVPLGPLRRAGAAAVVSVRRHGESAAHVHDADRDRGRQVAGRRCSRTNSRTRGRAIS